jgi:uncharacterized membrane protein
MRLHRLIQLGASSLVLALLGIAIGASASSAAAGYRPVDLGTLPGGFFSQAFAVNTAGVAVGFSNGSGIVIYHATVWRSDHHGAYQATDLTPSDQIGVAQDVSDSGVVAGYRATGDFLSHAALWRPNGAGGYVQVDLGELPGDTSSMAAAIGPRGSVVGSSGTHAVVWRPAGAGFTVTDLGLLPGAVDAQAQDIGARATIVGSVSAMSFRHATIWTLTASHSYAASNLGTLPGDDNSQANGVNPAGLIVGLSERNATGATLPVVWNHAGTGYAAAALPSVPGVTGGVALGVSPGGLVAGWSGNDAALWRPARGGYQVIDLGTLPGGTYSRGRAINAAGVVAGDSGAAGNFNGLATLWLPA